MTGHKVYTVIGLMSGTSLDGVDAALIQTDGHHYVHILDFMSVPYNHEERENIKASFGLYDLTDNRVKKAEHISTQKHIEAVHTLLKQSKHNSQDIDLIGYHGQTIYHAPQDNVTIQIGDGKKLSQETNIDVINNFRHADVAAGGEGAPLIPLYHQALVHEIEKPIAIVNIGGVANITYLGKEGDILAFDTGTGNALIDDWVFSQTGQPYDENGALAKQGRISDILLQKWMGQDYFKRLPPKSLDRDAWNILPDLANFSLEDGAAILTAFTVEAIIKATEHLPSVPENFYICGGGRHNKTMMTWLGNKLTHSLVKPIEDLGWDGDAIEAQGFAYLAVRSLLGLPLSLPSTTSVLCPMTGGVLHRA